MVRSPAPEPPDQRTSALSPMRRRPAAPMLARPPMPPSAPMGPTPPIRHWSTDLVPPAQRLDYWIGAICEGFLEMDATSPGSAAPFTSTLTSAALGPIGLNRVSGSAQDVYRTGRGISRSRENFFYLLCNGSAWAVAQDGHAARLLPGDLTLVDSRRRYEFHFPVVDALSIELPMAWVEAWLPDAQAAVARRIDGSQGWGRALSAFVVGLQPELAGRPPLPAPLLVDQLGVLLALATGAGESPQAPAPPALRQQVLDAIAERHADPGLTARDVAQALGTSERSLHRSLAGSGTSFAQALMARRVAVAQRLLADARFDRLSIAEIGRRVGLLDASHFVRACRQRLGATPGALRRRR
jgi:AraC family transcriptional activator of tynA and feaB